jgi:hypothetical protein
MDELHLSIADLHILVRCNQLPIHQENDLAYLPFLEAESSFRAPSDIEVELEVGKPLDVRGWSKTFEDGQSWTIYRHDNEYAMHFAPKKHGMEPLWVAYFSQDCQHMSIKCSERLICERNGKMGLLNPFRYPLDQHLIMYHLAHKKGILIHAAGFALDDQGLIFPGRSGAGKSTLTRLLSHRKNWDGLSDDRILVRESDSALRCFGTPWPGEEGVAKNKAARLSGIFFLCHDQENAISQLTPQEAVQKLMPVVSIPWYDEDLLTKLLPLCADFVSRTPAFELCFKPTEEIGEFLDEFLTSEVPL